MNSVLAMLERRLILGYQDQLRHYERALTIVSTHGADAAPESWIQELADALRDVAHCDADLSKEKDAWEQSGRAPGSELRLVLERLAGVIHTLAGHLDGQIAETLARRNRLLPEIDAFSRQRQMIEAYETNRPPS